VPWPAPGSSSTSPTRRPGCARSRSTWPAPGGAAGAGVGLGAGIAMGQTMGQVMASSQATPARQPVQAGPLWTLNVDGKNQGPYTEQALIEMIRAGQVGPETLVWKPGDMGWAPAASHRELAAHMPPPPPPAR